MAEHLAHFEVLAERQLQPDCRPLCRLRVHDLESLLASSPHGFKQPYDPRFGKMMVKAASHVLCLAELEGVYGFAEHGELSLLIGRTTGERSARDLVCRVVAEASSKLSVLLGEVAVFDANLYEFPNSQLVMDYFRWRQHQAVAETLDRHCTWVLVSTGADPAAVPKILEGLGVDEKVEVLSQNDIDYLELPLWQRRGTGIIVRPDVEGEPAAARLVVDTTLPEEEAYAQYLRPLLT